MARSLMTSALFVLVLTAGSASASLPGFNLPHLIFTGDNGGTVSTSNCIADTKAETPCE